ncbi:rep protein [Circoviridae sp.]|nr:rep protein [Circoviridae sp.]UOF82562.1 rep protein [Circoviridae sp.]
MVSNPVYKKKNDIIDFENMIDGVFYAITINPNDKHQYFHNPIRLGNFLTDLKKEYLYKIDGTYEFDVYPEVSSKGRLHWHGFIKVYDKVNFYLFDIPNIIRKGTLVIREMNDEDSWLEYVTKHREFHTYIREHNYTKIPIRCKTKHKKNIE